MLCKYLSSLIAMSCLIALSTPAYAVIEFDQNVTPDVIFGSGNANGGFTTDRQNGVELGLRGKLRHNESGLPENTFNSNGDGTYTFHAGVAPTQSFPTAVWSFEWSINSDYDGTSTFSLDDLTYELSMTSSTGASIPVFDPINGVNPGTMTVFWDHSIGTNLTANGAGTEATDEADYATLIGDNNLAQNSWKPHWFALDFDPTKVGTYDFILTAIDGDEVVASTSIQINTIPEPATLGLALMGGLFGTAVYLRRRWG